MAAGWPVGGSPGGSRCTFSSFEIRTLNNNALKPAVLNRVTLLSSHLILRVFRVTGQNQGRARARGGWQQALILESRMPNRVPYSHVTADNLRVSRDGAEPGSSGLGRRYVSWIFVRPKQ